MFSHGKGIRLMGTKTRSVDIISYLYDAVVPSSRSSRSSSSIS